MAVIVDAGGERDDGVDHAASFTRVHREGVGGDERERACIVEGAVAKVVVELVEVGGHTADLGLRRRVGAEGFHQLGGTTRCDPRIARSGGGHAARGHAGKVAVRTTVLSADSARLRRSMSQSGEVGA